MKKYTQAEIDALKHISKPGYLDIIDSYDFSNSDLSGLTFSSVFFRNCKFYRTNFTKTDLQDCLIWDADLRGADFTETGLRYIGFHKCDFRGAKLKWHRKGAVAIHECDLSGVDFNGMSLYGFSLYGSNLTNATGLTKKEILKSTLPDVTSIIGYDSIKCYEEDL